MGELVKFKRKDGSSFYPADPMPSNDDFLGERKPKLNEWLCILFGLALFWLLAGAGAVFLVKRM